MPDDGAGAHLYGDYAQFLLASFINSIDDAIISTDLAGVVRTWNTGALRLFGYAGEEMIGQSIFRLIPQRLHPETGAIVERVMTGERIEHYETVRVRRDGQEVSVSTTLSPIKDGFDRIIGTCEIARDADDGRRSDESRFRLAAIVDSADDAIISKDLNGVILTWNEGARRLFGYTSEEMVGQPLLRLIPKDLEYEEAEILRKLRVGERIEHYETIRVKKNGETVDVSVTISPIRNRYGEVVGASKIARDISDRKRVEKLLIQAEKIATTGRMAATIAHEINNPLEAVMNLVFLARQNCLEPERTLKYLLSAESELERVSHIARQTLGYYRDTGSPSEVYMHDLIENVLTVYESKFIANGISLDKSFNDLRKITVFKGELIQVFSNIIANAIDSMPGGGTLGISVRKTSGPGGEGIETVIRDQGVGIPSEDLMRVFEPFFTTKGNLGTGIGLWVVKQLVERRGGQITLHSLTMPSNNGTTISIYLPFAFNYAGTSVSDAGPLPIA